MVKNLLADRGDIRDVGSIPGLGRSPGGGNSNSLHYSCLENPMDREALWATVHGVIKSQTRLNQLSSNIYLFIGLHCLACGILVPQPGIEPVPPIGEAENLNSWTTREVPHFANWRLEAQRG